MDFPPPLKKGDFLGFLVSLSSFSLFIECILRRRGPIELPFPAAGAKAPAFFRVVCHAVLFFSKHPGQVTGRLVATPSM